MLFVDRNIPPTVEGVSITTEGPWTRSNCTVLLGAVTPRKVNKSALKLLRFEREPPLAEAYRGTPGAVNVALGRVAIYSSLDNLRHLGVALGGAWF